MPELAFDTRNYLLNGKPTSLLTESFPRDQISTDLTASLVTQVMTSVAIPLTQGDRVVNLSFLSGATAASVPTNWWFALYDTAGALLQQTADQTTTAWAADTLKTLALAAAVVIPSDGVYFAAIMVKATTVPTLMGKTTARAAAAGSLVGSQKVLAQNSGSALTTTAPATIATPTTQAVIPYCAAT